MCVGALWQGGGIIKAFCCDLCQSCLVLLSSVPKSNYRTSLSDACASIYNSTDHTVLFSCTLDNCRWRIISSRAASPCCEHLSCFLGTVWFESSMSMCPPFLPDNVSRHWRLCRFSSLLSILGGLCVVLDSIDLSRNCPDHHLLSSCRTTQALICE